MRLIKFSEDGNVASTSKCIKIPKCTKKCTKGLTKFNEAAVRVTSVGGVRGRGRGPQGPGRYVLQDKVERYPS